MDPTLLAAFVAAAAVLSLMPGPDMLFVVANALAGGRRAGVVSALGISNGIAVHTLAAAFGMGALLQAAPMALDVVRLCGAAFLVYLAVTSWRASRERAATAWPTGEPVERTRSIRRVYVMGLLTNIANPKVVLFYLAFFPQFLTTGGQAWPATAQFLLLGLTLMVVGLAIDSSVGLLAGTVAARVLRRQGFRRWVSRVSAMIFGGLAVRIALDAR